MARGREGNSLRRHVGITSGSVNALWNMPYGWQARGHIVLLPAVF